MADSLRNRAVGILSGKDCSLSARALRLAAATVEPLYACVMRIRNFCFDRGIFASFDLSRPVISVGNITTGGTGKTPMVIWLVQNLCERGKNPAVLLRGYRSTAAGISDEQQLLQQAMNSGDGPGVTVRAGASRVDSASAVLLERPATDVFVLDDGFQHRRVKRQIDIVLISAPDPFGFNHVLPRGLLREPLKGLGRATIFVMTRSDLVDPAALNEVQNQLRRFAPKTPVFSACHRITGFLMAAENRLVPVEALATVPVAAFAGIGDPDSFGRQLQLLGLQLAWHQWFPDHHDYTENELKGLLEHAGATGVKYLVTTAKDHVKISGFAVLSADVQIAVATLQMVIDQGDELLNFVLNGCHGVTSSPAN